MGALLNKEVEFKPIQWYTINTNLDSIFIYTLEYSSILFYDPSMIEGFFLNELFVARCI